jgi:glycolate oxidase FAD binding subunit
VVTPAPRPAPASIASGVVQLAEANRAALAVDGLQPIYVAAPDSAEDAARILGWASEERLGLVPRGGGTRMGLGNVPAAYHLALSTQRMNRLVEHEPADLTVTVQAGLPFEELQAALKAKGQFLPLDPPARRGSTIGGVVAANASGPSRLRHGSARDLVIGTQVATAAGTVAKAGGKVVKNVTGYDLNKLYVGSLGSLALITELTFKVAPLPEHEATVLIRFPDYASACACVYRVLRSPITPTALEVSRVVVDDALEVGLLAHLSGFKKPVDRMIGDLASFARIEGAARAEQLDPTTAAESWQHARDGVEPATGGARLKVAVPISQVAWACQAAESLGVSAWVSASAGTGTLRVTLEPGGDLVAAIRRLRAEVGERYGTVQVEDAPLAVKEQVDVLGEPGDSLTIMRRLKQQLDPNGVMSPGRFLGRL